ncbi:sugar O-acetyltransferase [Adhaeribacter sp. BT258]|uniref:Sugar O-acetyltransferase n=1 Tax=Adhaeribacter terrigena TaxID=2793070 RepID=A0ABS1C2Q4_9BACT|nr:sugar O-acetyltransferase [Adhaeribacter terrigena]MBK0403678.1 sugar O-acetyltransferase [Adhaeribacter terrigena]
MITEKEKMLREELYNATDPQLTAERHKARNLLQQFNNTGPGDSDLRFFLLQELFGKCDKSLQIEPPFYCDYGYNITVGEKVFFNFNCVILDVMPVTIGNQVLFGPNVQLYTATHPLNWQERASGLESGKAITIGSHVWLGGGVIVCPGVSIGDRSVIGAGSVVTSNIPADVFAAGNPCRIIRDLSPEARTLTV